MTTLPPLAALEPRLRNLLPADLYAAVWVDPSPVNLTLVFEHLRALQRILRDYVPRQVAEVPPTPGELRWEWQEGMLMFTDLAGFTSLVEAHAAQGRAGANTLLEVLTAYFAEMIEISSKAGGNLLEFTGDALLIQFPADAWRNDVLRAVRAGLRMQRAMAARFTAVETPQGRFALGMRVGLHTGRFLIADIGTPRRMEHVLLGGAVQLTKRAEAAGRQGWVCLTETAHAWVKDDFRFEAGQPGYWLVVDDLAPTQLGEYDITTVQRRAAGSVLFDRSVAGLVAEITAAVRLVEPLACYLPVPVLNLLVESTARRRIAPDFVEPTTLFVNFIGLPEAIDRARPGEEEQVVASFSRAFALINAAVEARGGILKRVTYHLAGSDILIIFGVLGARTDDTARAADTALAIRDIITNLSPPSVAGRTVELSCQMGMARGPALAAEIGAPRGRREHNIHGDAVNTAARLMGRAVGNRILVTRAVYDCLAADFDFKPLGSMPLKGKTEPIAVYDLIGRRQD